MTEGASVYVIGPGERGQELIWPTAVVSTFEEAEAFAKGHWDVEVEPMEGRTGMWCGRRQRLNPVDLIFVFQLPLGT